MFVVVFHIFKFLDVSSIFLRLSFYFWRIPLSEAYVMSKATMVLIHLFHNLSIWGAVEASALPDTMIIVMSDMNEISIEFKNFIRIFTVFSCNITK
jgi:hypothetical protein